MNENLFLPKSKEVKSQFKLGTIVSVDSAGATIAFDGETATSKKYKPLKSYIPVAGNRVIIAWISGTGIILGNY